jgi:hypothetical protein
MFPSIPFTISGNPPWSEQLDGDLRVPAPLLGEPGLAGTGLPGLSLEIERADVVEHQARRAQPRVRRARGHEFLPTTPFA